MKLKKLLAVVLIIVAYVTICSFTYNTYMYEDIKFVLKSINEKPTFKYQKKTSHLKFNVYGWETKKLVIYTVNDTATEVINCKDLIEYNKVLTPTY